MGPLLPLEATAATPALRAVHLNTGRRPTALRMSHLRKLQGTSAERTPQSVLSHPPLGASPLDTPASDVHIEEPRSPPLPTSQPGAQCSGTE